MAATHDHCPGPCLRIGVPPWAAISEDPENNRPLVKRLKREEENDDRILAGIQNLQDTLAVHVCGRLFKSSVLKTDASSIINPVTTSAEELSESLTTANRHKNAVVASNSSSAFKKAEVVCNLPKQQSSLATISLVAPSEYQDLEVDFASAPSDPEELALWVANQILLCTSDITKSVVVESERRRRSLSHAPGARMRERNDKDLGHVRLADIQKTREQGRLRKARWRQRAEEANKDNDLRCRLYSRGKKIFGEASSDAKTEWMNAEFMKRKAKRTQRESYERESQFTGFSVPQELGAELFSVGNEELESQIAAAGTLLLNTLYIVTSPNGPPSNEDAAFVLNSALDDPELDTQPFVEALRILSANSDIISSILSPSRASSKGSSRATSKASGDSLGSKSLASDFSTCTSSLASGMMLPRKDLAIALDSSVSSTHQKLRIRGGISSDIPELPDEERKLQAINTAIDILDNMADGKTTAHFSSFRRSSVSYETPYKTPYKTPYPNVGQEADQSTKINSSTPGVTDGVPGHENVSSLSGTETDKKDKTNDANAVSAIKEGKKPAKTEEAQADLLLRFAGISSDFGDDDDDVVELYSTTRPQPDTDVDATLERLYQILENRDAITGTAQAAALRSAIHDAGLATKNHYVSRELGIAIGRLYTLLADRSKLLTFRGRTLPPLPIGPPIRPPGNIVPQHPGHAFPNYPGSGFPYNRGQLFYEHPGGVFTSPLYPGGYFVPQSSNFRPSQSSPPDNVAYSTRVPQLPPMPIRQAPPFVPSSMPPPPVPTRIGTARGKTAEEAKKVRDFGFPPLPGSRPGESTLGMKRKSLA